MICKKCGTRFSDGMFCPECGASMALVVNLEEKGIEHFEEDCDASKYGTYGELEKQRINQEIKIKAGGKKVFENKKLTFKSSIIMEEKANLEFLNCSLEIDDEVTAIRATRRVNITFEHCDIKGKGKLITGGYGEIKFEYCDIKEGNMTKRSTPYGALNPPKGSTTKLIDIGNAYFEKCIIRKRCIGLDTGGTLKLELRNCIIITTEIIGSYINLENCSINDSFYSIYGAKKTSIKNCYFDDCCSNE